MCNLERNTSVPTAEQMELDEDTTHRRSLVDVFEGFFADDIDNLPHDTVASLPNAYVSELVETIDEFLEDAREQNYPDEAVMLDALSSACASR